MKDWIEHTNKIHGNGGNLNDLKSITVDNLENGKKYNLKFMFIPNGAEPIEKSYVFKAVSGFQISDIQLDSINYLPCTLFQSYLHFELHNFLDIPKK